MNKKTTTNATNATNSKTAALSDMICDAMSPQGIALMIAELQGATCKDEMATAEVQWMVDVLMNTVGGPGAVSSLYEEIGV